MYQTIKVNQPINLFWLILVRFLIVTIEVFSPKTTSHKAHTWSLWDVVFHENTSMFCKRQIEQQEFFLFVVYS